MPRHPHAAKQRARPRGGELADVGAREPPGVMWLVGPIGVRSPLISGGANGKRTRGSASSSRCWKNLSHAVVWFPIFHVAPRRRRPTAAAPPAGSGPSDGGEDGGSAVEGSVYSTTSFFFPRISSPIRINKPEVNLLLL